MIAAKKVFLFVPENIPIHLVGQKTYAWLQNIVVWFFGFFWVNRLIEYNFDIKRSQEVVLLSRIKDSVKSHSSFFESPIQFFGEEVGNCIKCISRVEVEIFLVLYFMNWKPCILKLIVLGNLILFLWVKVHISLQNMLLHKSIELVKVFFYGLQLFLSPWVIDIISG